LREFYVYNFLLFYFFVCSEISCFHTMALGIEDLKAKVSTMSSTWDATGDGKLDADDIFKTFDKSGDGLLDESEIAPLVAQLSDQIDFNNALLEEMSSLEEAQLASQVAMKENKKKLGQGELSVLLLPCLALPCLAFPCLALPCPYLYKYNIYNIILLQV